MITIADIQNELDTHYKNNPFAVANLNGKFLDLRLKPMATPKRSLATYAKRLLGRFKDIEFVDFGGAVFTRTTLERIK